MKLITCIALSTVILFGAGEIKRPDPFFADGNRIVYSSTTKTKRAKSYTVTQVLVVDKVVRTGSKLYAECQMGYLLEGIGEGSFTPYYLLRYACDSLNFYAFAQNWCYVPINTDEYKSYESSGDSIVYPLQMKIGDTLPDAFATTRYSIYETKIAYNISFSARKVLGIDTIDTQFGRCPAYRLYMKTHYEVKSYETQSGGNRNLVDTEILEWFSPDYGVIKYEYVVPDGAISSIMTSYKQ